MINIIEDERETKKSNTGRQKVGFFQSEVIDLLKNKTKVIDKKDVKQNRWLEYQFCGLNFISLIFFITNTVI